MRETGIKRTESEDNLYHVRNTRGTFQGAYSMSKGFWKKENTLRTGFMEERRNEYTDVATVESQRNDLTAEEFPEGPYGSGLETESLGKTSPWRRDQRPPNSFTWENREFHAGLSRQYPGDHPKHDETKDE
jgi:hypothetical protein